MKPIIDPKFAGLLPVLSHDEFSALGDSIIADGQRDPILVWKEKKIILDGHNRLKILKDLKIKPAFKLKSFGSRADAELWIITNQLCRRNLHPNHYAYYLGKKYEAEKGTGAHDEHRNLSDKLSSETGKGQATIRRNAAFANGVDKLEAAKPGFKATILNGATAMTKAMVSAIGKDDKITPQRIRKSLKQGKRPEKAFKPKKPPFEELWDFIAVLRWIDKAPIDFAGLKIVGKFFSDDPTGRRHIASKTMTKAVKLFSALKIYERDHQHHSAVCKS